MKDTLEELRMFIERLENEQLLSPEWYSSAQLACYKNYMRDLERGRPEPGPSLATDNESKVVN